MIEIGLVKYKQAETQLLELYQSSFGHDMNPELWNWKHTSNYIAPAEPEVIVAIDNDRIVGARPFLFIDMWLGNQIGTAAQHCDTMVHPEYQKQRLFNLMGQFSLQYLKENGCALSYGLPNQLSQHGFVRQGYKIIGAKEDMFLLLQPRYFMSNKLKNKLLGSVTGLLYDKLLVNKPKRLSGLSNSFQVFTSDQFIEELSQVDTLRDNQTIDLVRNESFLRWRFDNHPDFKYRYIAGIREGKLSGYAVIRVREEDGGLRKGLIVDFLIKNYDTACFKVLLDRCLIELEKVGCDSVHVRIIGKLNPMRELFKRSGFRSVLEFPYNRYYNFDANLDAILIQDQRVDYIDIYDKENWRVSYAFSDNE